MKSIWLLALVLLTNVSWAMGEEDVRYIPELHSAAWSPELTKEDISKMRFAIYAMSQGIFSTVTKELGPYIIDKRNVEARYIYSLALASRNINQALNNLRELSIEGYPYALETYGEERVCSLKQYSDICDDFGFDVVKKRAYINWAEKDPLVPHMFVSAFNNSLNGGYNGVYRESFTNEGETLLEKGAESGSYHSARLLYNMAVKNENSDDYKSKKQIEYYRALTKKNLIEGSDWGYRSIPASACYENEKLVAELKLVCLNSEEHQLLLDNLSKYGNLKAYDELMFFLVRQEANIRTTLSDYIRHGDKYNDLTSELKEKYDRAIELNNGRGWAYHGYQKSIENWEKLFNDKKTKGFFEKIGSMFN
ncbi:hypothetical protein L1D13_16845 [Vibrio tubiashii]|uniref:hypothetical protein n=1 Tax=Vibrio tubiashii TaxID=29498 RepID=UPI001EFD1CC0|nr:hypothetical protein [Vibrio tubiashii]MCG9582337.1 hypothetical protein [Vibrio tubiashii]MCG9615928.1 hypothetical protein [Vibrio tubiashii]MCG9688577.1 hypothetical protein [Vibrio tubiashii]